ncbi:MAG: NAD(P)-dependent alcohol dehydrogenase [Bacteroidia bacterium]
MKAIITTRYGAPDVLQLREVEVPNPKDNEVLIRIHASPVTAADTMMRKGKPYFGRLFIGLTKPKNPIPGTGIAGVVQEIGKDVTLFQTGDEVFGEIVLGPGTNAEYVCVPQDGVLAKKPSNITFEEASTVSDGALTSICFLKDIADVKPGQKVLINGASGSLGTTAVQLAKSLGAEVTGVCSTSNLAMVKELGADYVIDYTQEDFTRKENMYDVIYDTVGKSSFSKCKNALTMQGKYVSPVLSLPLLFQVMWTAYFGLKKASFSATGLRPIPELRAYLKELQVQLTNGSLRLIIDKRYNLDQAEKAHAYVDKGHKKGNVVLIMG